AKPARSGPPGVSAGSERLSEYSQSPLCLRMGAGRWGSSGGRTSAIERGDTRLSPERAALSGAGRDTASVASSPGSANGGGRSGEARSPFGTRLQGAGCESAGGGTARRCSDRAGENGGVRAGRAAAERKDCASLRTKCGGKAWNRNSEVHKWIKRNQRQRCRL